MKINPNKIFAQSGSCFAEPKVIKGKSEGITFTSKEFTGTMNSQKFWDELMYFAKSEDRFIILYNI